MGSVPLLSLPPHPCFFLSSRVYVWCGSAARALDRALTLSRALAFQRSLEAHIDKVLRIYRAPNRYVSLSAAVRGFNDPSGPYVARGPSVAAKDREWDDNGVLEQSPLVRACCGRNPLFLRCVRTLLLCVVSFCVCLGKLDFWIPRFSFFPENLSSFE